MLDAADRKTPFPGELTVGFARAAATADHKPPFPGELTVGFPGESKPPTAALKAPTVALTGVLLAVASGMEKRGGDKEAASFPDSDRLGAIGVEGVSVCLFLSALVARELGGGALP